MNPKALAVVAFRALSVYLMIWGLTNSTYMFGFFQIQKELPSEAAGSIPIIGPLAYGLAIALPILGGLVLWRRAPGLAVRAVREEAGDFREAPFSLAQIQAVALSTLGLLLIFWNLPFFLVGAYELFTRTPSEFSPITQNPFKATELVSVLLEILLGLWLALGARSWARILEWTRELGLEGKK